VNPVFNPNLQTSMNMRNLAVLLAALSTTCVAQATLYTTNWNSGFANGNVVPDNSLSGWADTRTVVPSGTLTSLSVTLQLSGGWNGDLYAYLVHGTGFSVLLNRVGTGVSGVSSYGYGDAGMNVILAATGTNIHQYGGNSTFTSAPTGTWMTDNTSGSLGSFLSTDPNGTWTLFIADLSGGGVTTVQGWGLQMDIVAVPEIETWVAAAVAGAFGAFWLSRQMFSGPAREHALSLS
jgi:subtilisin-like proprotein convertase family protein